MNGWLICLLVLLGLWLLGSIRLGGDVEYSQGGVVIRVRVGPVPVQIYPGKQKAEPGDRGGAFSFIRKKKGKSDLADTPKAGGSVERFKRYFSLGCEAAGALKRRIRVDALRLDLLVAGEDPAKAALLFGRANGALGMLWPVLEQNFDVRDHQFRVGINFQQQKPSIYGFAAFSAPLRRLLSFAIRYGIKFLQLQKDLNRSAVTKKEAI